MKNWFKVARRTTSYGTYSNYIILTLKSQYAYAFYANCDIMKS